MPNDYEDYTDWYPEDVYSPGYDEFGYDEYEEYDDLIEDPWQVSKN